MRGISRTWNTATRNGPTRSSEPHEYVHPFVRDGQPGKPGQGFLDPTRRFSSHSGPNLARLERFVQVQSQKAERAWIEHP
jgi:hypothetical protein